MGAGGIMLPNHAPLVIAGQFGTLDALFPGRIDLGLGRAPGTVAWALRRGLPTAVVERVAAALPRPPRSPALHAVADLVAHRFEPDSAATLIIDAVQAGVPQDRLLDVSTATLHEVQRGRNRFEALATVRQLLPNVPAPAKPGHGAVAGARRPAPTPP